MSDSMNILAVFKQLGIALGLGLLVGLQRERTHAPLGGFRTFPLVTILGTLAALLAEQFDGWVLGLGWAGLAGIILTANLTQPRREGESRGITTEVAMLVMFAVGAYLVLGPATVAIAVGGGVAVLLHLKPEMHAIAGRIGDKDFKAIMQFVLLSLVVLPVLPNQFYGPFAVLNPFRLWLMVVLIVGISLAGYVLYKFFGDRVGTLLGGILGGLISSTATTVGFARRSRAFPEHGTTAAVVIMLASAVVFARVLILIGATGPAFLRSAAGPLAIMLLVVGFLAVGLWLRQTERLAGMPEQENPSGFKVALVFVVLYAAVLLGVAAAKEYFGERGLYFVAIVSGLADMDAITLSVTQLVTSGKVDPPTGWRLILVASMSNLFFKAGTIAVLGDRTLFRRIALLFALAIGAGMLLLTFWPR